MAVFPQGLTQIDQRCNTGERRVLHQLKRCLGDDHLVWHDVPLGPRARQPDFVVLSPRWGVLLLEVKDWRRGTLAEATRDSCTLSTPRGRVVQPHPLRQARDHAMELVELMQHDPALVHADGPFAGKLLFPYGWGMVFSALRRDELAGSEDFDTLFPPARTLLRDDLDETVPPEQFHRRLSGMFKVHYPHTLTLPQRDRVRWHLFPELRLPTQVALDFGPGQGQARREAHQAGAAGPARAAAAPPSPLPDLMQVMDLQQEQLARTLGEGHRVVHGVAGSGKTMILVYRAQQLAQAARPEQPILVLCFNRALAERIDGLLRQRGVDERVVVRTFHAWCQDLVRSYSLDTPRRPPDAAGAEAADGYWQALAQVVERAVDTGRVPGGQYSALMIDEAHDFEEGWLRLAARMVHPATRSLLVLYDDAQSIYQQARRRFSFSSVGIEARGRTSVLRLNYRNTAEVLALAMRCAQELLQGVPAAAAGGVMAAGAVGPPCGDDDRAEPVLPASAGRRGPLPVLIEARDAVHEAALLAERLAEAQAGGLALREMAVLCRSRQALGYIATALRRRGLACQSMHVRAVRDVDWRADDIKLLTMHSAKGLEFALVCVAGLQALPLRDERPADALRLLYVAMTRATGRLLLSAHRGTGAATPLLDSVRQALREVEQQFSAAPAAASAAVPAPPQAAWPPASPQHSPGQPQGAAGIPGARAA